MKECIIEMEDKPETSFTNLITLKCAHSGSVCFECMHNYITSQLDSGIEHIKCPVLGCDEHMEAQDIQRQTDDRGYLRYDSFVSPSKAALTCAGILTKPSGATFPTIQISDTV